MPTYDYQCSNCEHAWEAFQSMSARPLKKCPNCGKQTAKRLIGIGAGVIFKGGGFYETDYRDGKYAADAKKDSGESSAGEGKAGDTKDDKAETKAESKTDSKPESKPAETKPESKPAAKKPAAKSKSKK